MRKHVLVCFKTKPSACLHTCVEINQYNKPSHFLKVVQEYIYAQIAHINWQWHAFIYQCLKQCYNKYHFLIGRHHVTLYAWNSDKKECCRWNFFLSCILFVTYSTQSCSTAAKSLMVHFKLSPRKYFGSNLVWLYIDLIKIVFHFSMF